MMKYAIPAAIAAIFAAQAASAQTVPGAVVAVVDVQRILATCTACKSAASQLTSENSAIEARVRTLQSQLQTEGQAIETAAKALNGKQPDAALQARYAAFQKKQEAAQQEIASKQETLRSKTNNVQNQLATRITPIVNSVMTQRGANLVLEKNATMANANALEITDTVLAELNRQLPSVSVTPLPAAKPAGR